MLLHTARGVKASAFKNVDLLYVHCVSEEKFTVSLKGFSCVTLVCRETHVSYLENMSERRRCLIPDVVENQSVDVLLERKAAPLLVRVNSSCDITVSCEIRNISLYFPVIRAVVSHSSLFLRLRTCASRHACALLCP